MGVIYFNGKSSRDYGIIVEDFPTLCHPGKRGEAYQILGRSGNFYREDGTYHNYVQPYNIAIREGRFRRADLRSNEIAAWLLGSAGYCRLADSFEPEHFRLARFAGPMNIEQIMGLYGRATLEFDCRPERWLKSGETPADIIQKQTVYNPTAFPAKPIIKVTSDEDIVIAVNGFTFMTVVVSAETTAIIDCDACTVTNETGVSLMGSVEFGSNAWHGFPELPPGLSTFTLTGDETSFQVVPRWWTV